MMRRGWIFAALFGLAGCGAHGALRTAGPAAKSIAGLSWLVIIMLGVIAAILWVLIVWGAVRRHGSLHWHDRWNRGGGQGWILIGGFAIPFAILSILFGFTLQRLRHFPIDTDPPTHADIQVIGHQWWWEVHYVGEPTSRQVVTANEIHIPVDKAVVIALDSDDVIHSFWVPALHGKVELMPGQTNYVTLAASRPGTFYGRCSEYCGAEHARMLIRVVAQPAEEFQAWINQQLKPATEPTTPQAMRGRELVVDGPCALCHTIAGTAAAGTLGPDLTHIASRQAIASNSYANNLANLEAWVTHAQSLKPGAEMPNLTMFNGTQLRDIVAYLRELH